VPIPIHNELPTPPRKPGWPWTEESPFLPDTMPDGSTWPKISIVTPSFNQSKYLEETIRSVLLQGYPNLEYIIIDGGSTDGSVEIIKKYGPWLAYWVSEPDQGQSDAINKGWSKATGNILAYLNSDDTYFPSALAHVAALWVKHPGAAVFTGATAFVDEQSAIKSITLPFFSGHSPVDLTLHKWYLPQQSSFFNKSILDKVGRYLRKDLHFLMDKELMYRLAFAGTLVQSNTLMATYRFHDESKSISMLPDFYFEVPLTFNNLDHGTIITRFKRFLIGSSAVGRGYFLRGNHQMNKFKKIRDYCKALFFHPAYIINRGYWRKIADESGLLPVFQKIRRIIREH
jgi:glycosyltransferase involved in cell wall biosynthesis